MTRFTFCISAVVVASGIIAAVFAKPIQHALSIAADGEPMDYAGHVITCEKCLRFSGELMQGWYTYKCRECGHVYEARVTPGKYSYVPPGTEYDHEAAKRNYRVTVMDTESPPGQNTVDGNTISSGSQSSVE